MKEWIKEYKIFVSVILLVVFLSIYYFFSPAPPPTLPTNENIPTETSEIKNEQTEATKKVPQKIMVDLKGAIKNPGVYEAREGERVVEIIKRAGGLSDNADESKVNLAMHVEDEMVLYIPMVGELVQETQGFAQSSNGGLGAGSLGSESNKININSADEAELETLPGIGPSKSAAIIEYRTTTGPFKSIEDIQSISGIGEKTFEKLKDKIAID